MSKDSQAALEADLRLRLRLPDGTTVEARAAPFEEADPREPPPEPTRPDGRRPPWHSADFTTVVWADGATYTFTPTQRAIVKELWEHWRQGTPDVGQTYLLTAADSETPRLHSLFKRHPAWHTLIVPSAWFGGPAGCYRLAPIPDPTTPEVHP